MADLTEVCAYLKNYFLKDEESKTIGTFTIVPNAAPLDSLLPNQYFRITGSVLNDGVWKNTAEDLAKLQAEEFDGQIWSMSVPRDFEKLCDDITAWREKNESADSANMSPFNSESFGGYSYSKGSNGNSGSNGANVSWQYAFSARLNTYRRIAI